MTATYYPPGKGWLYEHEAWQEFVAACGVTFRYLAWAYQQVAVVVEKIG